MSKRIIKHPIRPNVGIDLSKVEIITFLKNDLEGKDGWCTAFVRSNATYYLPLIDHITGESLVLEEAIAEHNSLLDSLDWVER